MTEEEEKKQKDKNYNTYAVIIIGVIFMLAVKGCDSANMRANQAEQYIQWHQSWYGY